MDSTEKPYKVSLKRRIYRVVILVLLFYGIIGLALFYLQEKLILHPEPLPRDYTFHFNVPFKEVSIAMNPRDTLNMVQFFPADSVSKGVVLYFHGNRDNINRYSKFAADFTKNGYEVWMPDYPSFGKSTGEFTEKLVYEEAREIYKLARVKFGADSIFVYGKSLGTGAAAYVAANEACGRLILETPYFSMPSLFSVYAPIYPTGRMSRFKFPVGEYLKKTQEPVTIFHGTSDKVVFYSQGEKLQQVLKPGDEFITINGGGHNDLREFELYRTKLDSLLNLF